LISIKDIFIVPKPKSIFPLNDTCLITTELIELLVNRFPIYNKESNIFQGHGSTLSKFVTCILDDSVEPQGYILIIRKNNITLAASANDGIFYGLMTLRQIIRQGRQTSRREGSKLLIEIPCCKIEDFPDYSVRGVMLDISRNRVPKIETLFSLIDIWAELKSNQLQLYTEHTFAYKRHSKVWEDASPYTEKDIDKLQEYCNSRCIDLVPNQNSFGHLEKWFIHPEYQHLAEAPDGVMDFWGNFHPYPTTLYPGSPESIEFLKELYDELLPHFSSNLFNVGLDETFDLCQGRSKKACKEHGMGKVYLDFLVKLDRLVRSYGKKMLYWADMMLKYPELLSKLPNDAVPLLWGYEADHPFKQEVELISDIHNGKLDFFICSGTSAWNSIGGRWKNAKENIENAVSNGLIGHATGHIITEWGDNGHWQQYPIALPGYIYGAALSWNYKGNQDINIESALAFHGFRYSTPGNPRISPLAFSPAFSLARALMILEDVYLETGVSLHNTSALNMVFFDHKIKDYAKSMRVLTVEGFRKAERKIHEALSIINKNADGLINDELAFTARLMLHACRLGEARIYAPGMSIAMIPAEEREKLEADLEPLVEEFSALWMKRDRPGGLSESLKNFRRILDLYRMK